MDILKATTQELKKKLKELKKEREKTVKTMEEIDDQISKLEDFLSIREKRHNPTGKIKLQGYYRREIPTNYDINSSLEKRVMYIINELKQPTVKEIAEMMIKEEDLFDYLSVYRKLQQVLLKQLKEGKITKKGDYAGRMSLVIIDE